MHHRERRIELYNQTTSYKVLCYCRINVVNEKNVEIVFGRKQLI